MIIINEQSGGVEGERTHPTAHHAPLHSDKHRKGYFFDLSLGYEREMLLTSTDERHPGKISNEIIPSKKSGFAEKNYIVAAQCLASASLAYISKPDNEAYKHMVSVEPKQPPDQPRFSVVARSKSKRLDGRRQSEHFARIDPVAAARVRPGGNLFKPYAPLHRLLPEERAARLAEVGWRAEAEECSEQGDDGADSDTSEESSDAAESANRPDLQLSPNWAATTTF
eukprot:2195130-Prymnesium_polylepis.1